MIGSLDFPPLVLRTSRWKTILGFAGSLPFAIISVVAIVDARSDGIAVIEVWFLYFTAGLFGLLVPAQFALLFWPQTMTISPDGLVIRGWFQKVSFAWHELSNIETMRIGSLLLATANVDKGSLSEMNAQVANRQISATFSVMSTLKSSRFAKGQRVDADQSKPINTKVLGFAWEIGPRKLVRLLNEARSRWVNVGGGEYIDVR